MQQTNNKNRKKLSIVFIIHKGEKNIKPRVERIRRLFRKIGYSYEIILKEKDALILKMTAKKLPLNRSESFEFHTFSLDEKTIMHSLVEGYAPKFGKKTFGRCGELELGSHRISNELRDLKLSK